LVASIPPREALWNANGLLSRWGSWAMINPNKAIPVRAQLNHGIRRQIVKQHPVLT
jgi:hypothetical protein